MAPEYGGPGGAFSSTDLLAAALGSCIATNIGPVAERHGIPLDTFEIHVEKALGQQPKWVTRLAVEVRCATQITQDMLDRLQRAAESCTVPQPSARHGPLHHFRAFRLNCPGGGRGVRGAGAGTAKFGTTNFGTTCHGTTKGGT